MVGVKKEDRSHLMLSYVWIIINLLLSGIGYTLVATSFGEHRCLVRLALSQFIDV